jgi:hypothetical protein
VLGIGESELVVKLSDRYWVALIIKSKYKLFPSRRLITECHVR